MEMTHVPVLLDEAVAALDIKPTGVYVDGTMGGGGHSKAIASRLTTGRLIGVDKDDYAHSRAAQNLADVADRVSFVRDDFCNLAHILDELDIPFIDGLLLDLGVSSFQLDDAARGFSYSKEAPLDMRMDRSGGITAKEVVNTYDERALVDIPFRYGEERHARRIAAAVVRQRALCPIETTTQLAQLVAAAMPGASRREAQHPAKRTFQALRIEVNNELGILEQTLRDAAQRLNVGGRIAVITFHSLEDRIVKETFAALAQGCTCPKEFPVCVCGKQPVVKLVGRKPVTPSPQELEQNPRSRSAKLRTVEKLPFGTSM